MKNYLSIALAIAGVSAVNAQVTIGNGQGTGPTPYLQTSDSPWLSQIGSANFYLEDFEDGLLNTPGVSATGANVIGPGGLTDSVDGDDGNVDGSGSTGRSFSGPRAQPESPSPLTKPCWVPFPNAPELFGPTALE